MLLAENWLQRMRCWEQHCSEVVVIVETEVSVSLATYPLELLVKAPTLVLLLLVLASE